jgi:hypothetical protein
MSVPFVHHLHWLSTYITGTVRRKRYFYPSTSSTNLQLDKKCIADPVPFSRVFSMRRNHKKKKILSLFSPQPCHSPRRGSMGKTWWKSTNKTKNHQILQQVYGLHRLFTHDAAHLFG